MSDYVVKQKVQLYFENKNEVTPYLKIKMVLPHFVIENGVD